MFYYKLDTCKAGSTETEGEKVYNKLTDIKEGDIISVIVDQGELYYAINN